MKRSLLVLTLALTVALVVLPVIACTTPAPTPVPTAPPPGKASSSAGKVPRRTPVVKMGGKASQGNLPTASAPSKASTSSAAKTVCPPLAAPQTKPSGYIRNLMMAEGYDNGELINPTNVFKPDATVHGTFEFQNIPANTSFKAVWYVNDIGDLAYCNKKMGESEWIAPSAGSGDAHFYHEPSTTYPVGTYRVEIYVNNTLDQVGNFSVK